MGEEKTTPETEKKPDRSQLNAQFAPQRQVISMAVHNQLCLVQAQFPAFIQQPLVHIYGDALRQEQVMAA